MQETNISISQDLEAQDDLAGPDNEFEDIGDKTKSSPVVQKQDSTSMFIGTRNLFVNNHEENWKYGFKDNKISTTKYSLLTFLPKNLFQQFSKLANVYFLFIAVLQCLPKISVSNQRPDILIPLTFVVLASAIKDAFEDYKRYTSDKEENYRSVLVADVNSKSFMQKHWQELVVGEIVLIKEDEYFPADLILLNTSEKSGVCYIETKNLDGETNLKHKVAKKETMRITSTVEDVCNIIGNVTCETPNPFLYKFNGLLKSTGNMDIPLDTDQFLLRGASLRNTEWVYGLVVYTGHESKVMMNSSSSKIKKSQLERKINKYIIYIFILQMSVCLFLSLASLFWLDLNAGWYNNVTYPEKGDIWDYSHSLNALILFGTWLLIFTNFVPISLLVTLELVRFIQGYFIMWDVEMFDEEVGVGAKVQSSSLNEELGQISHIFSDKTGTLTCNIMDFKKMSIGKFTYGTIDTTDREKNPDITNVDFQDDSFFEHLQNEMHENNKNIIDYIMLLAVCHTIIIENKNGKIRYNASSPDELALVNAAKLFGAVFFERDDESNINVSFRGEVFTFKLLNILEFSSARKRMSVIVRDPKGRILVMCKGADSIVMPLLKPGTEHVDLTFQYLEDYAKNGLRTLLLAQKEVDEEAYLAWEKEYLAATSLIVGREEEIERVSGLIEHGFDLIGTTAIEDKLQDDVAGTIDFIRNADIRLWVLTGDKIETAINIGFSCKVLDNGMHRFIVDAKDSSAIIEQLSLAKTAQIKYQKKAKYALIVAGDSLINIVETPEIVKLFLEVSGSCEVVIACRVSPKQKAEVVKLIRNNVKEAITLAIGDGANDVNMITAAHVGVGISGLEGQQAARASDYAITQFKHLRNLLFTHGREAYRRNAYLIGYFFYKNIIFLLPQFVFAFFSGFSGQSFYDQTLVQFYNLLYTQLPIMWFAVYDWEYDKQELLRRPIHYEKGRKQKLFNTRIFLRWIFYGTWQAVILCFVSIMIFNGVSASDGIVDDIWVQGSLCFLGAVVIVNIKVLQSTNTHTIYSVVWFTISILCFLLSHLVMNYLVVQDLYGTLTELLSNPSFYLGIFFLSFSIILVDVGLHRVRRLLILYRRPDKIARDTLLSKDFAKMLDKGSLLDNALTKQPTHKGYAFSQETGNIPQLLASIRPTVKALKGKSKEDGGNPFVVTK